MKLTFKVNQPVETVFDYLTNMEKFVSVHPVITRMVPVARNKYRVYETLRILFIPISFAYTATVEKNFGNKTVSMRVTVMKNTHVEMNYALMAEDNSTIVEELIHIQSVQPFKFILGKIFAKQHALLFENIDDVR